MGVRSGEKAAGRRREVRGVEEREREREREREGRGRGTVDQKRKSFPEWGGVVGWPQVRERGKKTWKKTGGARDVDSGAREADAGSTLWRNGERTNACQGNEHEGGTRLRERERERERNRRRGREPEKREKERGRRRREAVRGVERVCCRREERERDRGGGEEGGRRHGAKSGMLGGGGDGGHVAVSREKRERSERAP